MNGPHIATSAPVARPHAAPPRHVKPEPDGGNGLRVLTYLRLHWLMIAFCGTMLGLNRAEASNEYSFKK